MIRSFKLSELEEQCGGQRFGNDVMFDRVSIDSRDVNGALFIAIKGERLDGHDYIDDAIQNACAAVVSERSSIPGVATFVVEDSVAALGHAGAINRKAFDGSVIALTGSAGKTTTKNMIATVLAELAPVTATKANHNNEIGVPLTLLDISSESKFAVIEIGARHIGDIGSLGRFVRPDIALVLNAGSAHLGEFGSYENIVKTKGELYGCLKPGGVAVVNLDDVATEQWVSELGDCDVFSFSASGANADLRAGEINCLPEGTHFELCYRGEKQTVYLPQPGRHNVSNALAACAVAVVVGMTLSEIAAGLAKAKTVSGRLKSLQLSNGALVLDDSYNANPASMKAALDVLVLQPGAHIAVLGEMAELGDAALAMHLEVAEHAKNIGVNRLYCVGPYADEMEQKFGSGAMSYGNNATLATALEKTLMGNETILVKGSRSAQMEGVVSYLEGVLR